MTFAKFIDKLTDELIGMSDEDVLEGQDVGRLQAEARAILWRAQAWVRLTEMLRCDLTDISYSGLRQRESRKRCTSTEPDWSDAVTETSTRPAPFPLDMSPIAALVRHKYPR